MRRSVWRSCPRISVNRVNAKESVKRAVQSIEPGNSKCLSERRETRESV